MWTDTFASGKSKSVLPFKYLDTHITRPQKKNPGHIPEIKRVYGRLTSPINQILEQNRAGQGKFDIFWNAVFFAEAKSSTG